VDYVVPKDRVLRPGASLVGWQPGSTRRMSDLLKEPTTACTKDCGLSSNRFLTMTSRTVLLNEHGL
jgi:hypothetical protein